jgi:hypothetical protein
MSSTDIYHLAKHLAGQQMIDVALRLGKYCLNTSVANASFEDVALWMLDLAYTLDDKILARAECSKDTLVQVILQCSNPRILFSILFIISVDNADYKRYS